MNKTSEEQIMRGFGRSNDRRGNVNFASTSSTPVPQLSATQPQGRHFSNQCFYSRGRNKNSKVKGSKASTSGCFSRDLILLSGPNVRDVPRQGSKVTLQENGHIISAFNFRKTWSEDDVKLEIKEAFQGKLHDVDFEIFFAVNSKLSKPNLAPGQYLTGAALRRVFKDNKPVYILPSRELLDNTMSKEKGELNDSGYDSHENTQSSSQAMVMDFETSEVNSDFLGYQSSSHGSGTVEVNANGNKVHFESSQSVDQGIQSSSRGSETMDVNANVNEVPFDIGKSIEQDLGIGNDWLDEYMKELEGGSNPPDLYQLTADTSISSNFVGENSDSADGLEQAGSKSVNYNKEMMPCSGPLKGDSNPLPADTSSGFEDKNSDSADGLEQDYIKEMRPSSGPLKSQGDFIMLLHENLPRNITFPVEVHFDGCGTVYAVLENNVLRGFRIPESPEPKTVRVVVHTENGQYIGETKYTYQDEDKLLVEKVKTCSPNVASECLIALADRVKNSPFTGTQDILPYEDNDIKHSFPVFGVIEGPKVLNDVTYWYSKALSDRLYVLNHVKHLSLKELRKVLNDVKHLYNRLKALDDVKHLSPKGLRKGNPDMIYSLFSDVWFEEYVLLECSLLLQKDAQLRVVQQHNFQLAVNDFRQFLENILRAGRVSFTRYKHQLVHVAYGDAGLEEYMNCAHQRLQQLLCSENDETTDLVLVIEAVLKLIGHRNKAIDSSTAKPCVEESIDEESECDDDSGYCADDEAALSSSSDDDEDVSSFAFAVRDSPGGRHRHKSLQDNRVKKQKVGKENGSGRTNSTSTEMDCQMDDEDGSNEDFMEVIYTLRDNITVIPEGKLNVRNEEGMPDVNKIMQYFYQELYSVIQWAKAVPGFMELGVEDQVALLKAGFMDLNVFRLAYRSVACDPNSVLFGKDIICDRSTCIEMGWTPDLVDTTLEFTEKLRNLNLDQCEFACLSTLVLLSPDTPDLRNKVRVSELQSKISRCLKEYEDKIHPAKANRYSKLLLCLATLRSDGEKALENYITLEFFGKLVAELLD